VHLSNTSFIKYQRDATYSETCRVEKINQIKRISCISLVFYKTSVCVYVYICVFVCVSVSERCRTTIKPQYEHMVAPFTAADLVVTTSEIFL